MDAANANSAMVCMDAQLIMPGVGVIDFMLALA